ncbi:MAG: hypothetical protein AABW48_05180 [Nanoarchaeota archaeon]
MTLQLSGQSERLLEPHREFYGQPIVKMPLLVSGKDEEGKVIDVPRDPASFTYVLERRMEAPEDVREAWQKNYFFTGDGSTAGTKGDHLIVLDAQLLREITPESDLYNGALVLPADAWAELKRQTENVTHLTAQEVQEAQGQGYVKKNGVWTPANKTVGKVWDTLSRGRDLTAYVQLVSEHSPHRDSLLNIYFNQTIKDDKPTMRSWVASSTDYYSDAGGNYYVLDNFYGRLVGVAQKKVRSPPTLEQMLAIVNNPNLNKQGMAEAISKHYQK